MNRLVLGEYETLDEAALPLDEAVALAATGAVEVLRTASPGHWTVRAGKHVGAVRVGETELQIHPKVPVERLLYLLGYARDPRGWRDDEVLLAGVDELVPAMAVSFVALAHRALQQGVLQGYEEREESMLLLRGRLREGEQVRRRMGLALPLEVRYDEFTVDIAENRILLGAARRLLALPGVPAAARGSLVHLTAQLADVRAPVAGERFPVVGATRLNARYRPAIRLAELVLRGRSVELLAGGVRASGFLFDMNRVFEDWLTAALTAALSVHGGTVRPQLRTWLDEAVAYRSGPISPGGARAAAPPSSMPSTRRCGSPTPPTPTCTRCSPTARSWSYPTAISCTPRAMSSLERMPSATPVSRCTCTPST